MFGAFHNHPARMRWRTGRLYMVIEHFKNRDAKAVYRRFRERGRMAPEGLVYVESWVETNFDRCFQLMDCDDAGLLDQWGSPLARPCGLRVRSGAPLKGSRRTHHSRTMISETGKN
jgi:hypothetical protein